MSKLLQIRSKVKYYVYWNRKSIFSKETAEYEKWCAFAVEDGEFAYSIGDASGTAVAGELVFCPPGVRFHRKVIMPLSFHYFYFDWIHADTGAMMSDDAQLAESLSGKVSLDETNRLKSVFSYLRSLPHTSTNDHVLRWVDHLLDDLLFLYTTEHHFVPMLIDQPTSDPLMDQAALSIKRQAFSKVSLLNVASAFGLTPVQFSRRFAAAYKTNPHEYLTSLRLERAGKLLLETDLSLEEIAEKCGYQNGSYISRLFAKKLLITPSDFRKKHHL